MSQSTPADVRNFVEHDKALISAALNGDRRVLIRAAELIRDAEIAALSDPKRHPFATNGLPVEACLKCGHPEQEHPVGGGV